MATMGTVLQMVSQNHEMAEKGHKRLRDDYREIESKLILLEQAHKGMVEAFSQVERRAVDVQQLKLTPATVFFIVSVCLGIAGGQWVSMSGVRSDVRDMLTRMSAQADSIREIRAQQQMQDVKINNLRELVLSNTTPNARKP